MLVRVMSWLALGAIGLLTASTGFAIELNYTGTLAFIERDNGGPFTGTPRGTQFSIRIGDLNARDGTFANGAISGGGRSASFSCPETPFVDMDGDSRCSDLAAGSELTDNLVLDTDTADLLNGLFGPGSYAAGDQVDIFNVEGDDGEINNRTEAGLSFIFDANEYSGGPLFPNTTPQFDPAKATNVIFFVLQDIGDPSDIDQYSAFGPALPVPEPSTTLLWGVGLLSIFGAVRRARASS